MGAKRSNWQKIGTLPSTIELTISATNSFLLNIGFLTAFGSIIWALCVGAWISTKFLLAIVCSVEFQVGNIPNIPLQETRRLSSSADWYMLVIYPQSSH